MKSQNNLAFGERFLLAVVTGIIIFCFYVLMKELLTQPMLWEK